MTKRTNGIWTASRGCEVFLEEGKVTMVRDEPELVRLIRTEEL
jgi:hypothetical protein